GTPVIDDGQYRAALEAAHPDERPMFANYVPDGVAWPDGSRERVDSIVSAPGYRPHMPYLRSLGVLDEAGAPRHDRGVSTVLPRSEEHTSELQSRFDLVCRLLPEKKKQYVMLH